MQFLRLTILGGALVLACAATVSAQTSSCALKQAPALQGFRLGMTLAEVKGMLADSSMFDSKISAGNTVGLRAVNVNASELKPEYGDSVEGVYLSFVDDRLAHIKVTYSSAERWNGSDDFFARESESMGLPKPSGPGSLQGGRGNEKYVVECREFTATLAYSFGVSPSVAVFNTKTQKIVDRRQEKDDTRTKKINIGIGGPGGTLPPPTTPTPPTPRPPQSGEPNRQPFSDQNH
ncbi:MAG TPA: hypothetical protein VGX92_00625 [Pyrinomonadaceae bacterium]|jgi:hypothetical protein|nr:hypothetical protein [Pyrinomonadaceae bacterium]